MTGRAGGEGGGVMVVVRGMGVGGEMGRLNVFVVLVSVDC